MGERRVGGSVPVDPSDEFGSRGLDGGDLALGLVSVVESGHRGLRGPTEAARPLGELRATLLAIRQVSLDPAQRAIREKGGP